MKINTMSTFRKSVLSFFVISAVAGSFISWDKYQPRQETESMKTFYQDREAVNAMMLSSSVDSDTLANISEENLVAGLEFDLENEIEAQYHLSAAYPTEKEYSPEADEIYDYTLENEQLTQHDLAKYSVNDSIIEITAETANNEPDYLITESPLLFAFDSSEIQPQYYRALNETALFMQNVGNESDMVWQIVGYADLSGNYIYNNKLAKKRAQGVAEYLVEKGVSEDKLSIVSLGASNPINSERSVENNKSERRVEIHPYQAEVTALVKQFNQQLKHHTSVIKENSRAPMTAPVPTESLFEPITIERVVELETPSTDTFEQVITKTLTTAIAL